MRCHDWYVKAFIIVTLVLRRWLSYLTFRMNA